MESWRLVKRVRSYMMRVTPGSKSSGWHARQVQPPTSSVPCPMTPFQRIYVKHHRYSNSPGSNSQTSTFWNVPTRLLSPSSPLKWDSCSNAPYTWDSGRADQEMAMNWTSVGSKNEIFGLARTLDEICQRPFFTQPCLNF